MIKRSELIEELITLKTQFGERVDRLVAELREDSAPKPENHPDNFKAEPARQVAGNLQGRAPIPPSEIRDPLAKSFEDLVTPKQLGMMRALAREHRADVEEECQGLFRCRTDELSKRAASSFIDHLKSFEQQEASA